MLMAWTVASCDAMCSPLAIMSLFLFCCSSSINCIRWSCKAYRERTSGWFALRSRKARSCLSSTFAMSLRSSEIVIASMKCGTRVLYRYMLASLLSLVFIMLLDPPQEFRYRPRDFGLMFCSDNRDLGRTGSTTGLDRCCLPRLRWKMDSLDLLLIIYHPLRPMY